MSMTTTINLDTLTGSGKVHNLSGHLKGLAARAEFRLDELDEIDSQVEVVVPEHIFSVSPSFVQGMFSDSVHALGSNADGFFDHYRFIASELVMRQIRRGMERILTSRTLS